MRTWEPSTNDAMSLAAFRWFANALENASVEVYATNRASFKEVEEVLRHALNDLGQVRKRYAVTPEENGCPDGYVLCDGICAPACHDES
jgi:hypothetical protein